MHRFIVGVALGLVFVCGCDPIIRASIQVAPVTVAPPDTAIRGRSPTDALDAVERLALHFGLKPEENRSATGPKSWRGPSYDGNHALYVYAHVGANGVLSVEVGEIVARWSPRGDSLRKQLVDTLSTYGRVTTEPPNDR